MMTISLFIRNAFSLLLFFILLTLFYTMNAKEENKNFYYREPEPDKRFPIDGERPKILYQIMPQANKIDTNPDSIPHGQKDALSPLLVAPSLPSLPLKTTKTDDSSKTSIKANSKDKEVGIGMENKDSNDKSVATKTTLPPVKQPSTLKKPISSPTQASIKTSRSSSPIKSQSPITTLKTKSTGTTNAVSSNPTKKPNPKDSNPKKPSSPPPKKSQSPSPSDKKKKNSPSPSSTPKKGISPPKVDTKEIKEINKNIHPFKIDEMEGILSKEHVANNESNAISSPSFLIYSFLMIHLIIFLFTFII